MGYAKSIIPEPVRRVAFGAISGTFIDLGSILDEPVRLLQIKNTLDVTAEVSINGVDVHFELPPNSFDLYDISTNRTPLEMALLRAGIQLEVRRPAAEGNPTEGAVIVQTWIGEI